MEKAYYWPIWFINSLGIKTKNSKELTKICQGQVYLWRALNLYDNVMDDENQAMSLPQANNYYRNYLQILYQLPLPQHFFNKAEEIFLAQEQSNQEEMKRSQTNIKSLVHDKIPSFLEIKNLSQKSLPLALLPITSSMLYTKENKKISAEKDYLEKKILFFKYLLGVKQMADDVLDFKEDLQNNKLTRANYYILQKAKKNKVNTLQTKQYNSLFISVSESISQDIINMSNLVIDAGKNIGIDKDAPIIKNVIGKIIKKANRTIALKKML
jgi:hypothetical protein